MSQQTSPSLPLPEPITGSDPDSFAHYSVTVRLPEIAERMISENSFPAGVKSKLNDLVHEIGRGVIRHLVDCTAPDATDFGDAISPHVGKDWVSVPWFFAETYYYRRILEATGYFQGGAGKDHDPYLYQKHLGLNSSRPAIEALCLRLGRWLREGWSASNFTELLSIDLWGNQADLSLWPVGQQSGPEHKTVMDQISHLLIDDSSRVLGTLVGLGRPARVDFLIDNAGFELVCDLCMADYLLTSGASATVRFHLKYHPTFVSDATISDVEQTISFLADSGHQEMGELAFRLRNHLESRRLLLETHLFWTSPKSGWKMPDELFRQLRLSDLTLSKGDANYRRLLGDRHWPFTTPFEDVLSYFPSPLVALRTFKSEVAAGIFESQLETLNTADPGWMTNGKWGVIQFAAGSKPFPA